MQANPSHNPNPSYNPSFNSMTEADFVILLCIGRYFCYGFYSVYVEVIV